MSDLLELFTGMFLYLFLVPLLIMLPFVLLLRNEKINDLYEANKDKLILVAGVLFVAFIVWYGVVGNKRGQQWSGEGEINIFPIEAHAKNYRVDVFDMEVETKKASLLSNYDEYTVDNFQWPNGEYVYFIEDCVVSEVEVRRLCKLEDGREFYVEVQYAPEY